MIMMMALSLVLGLVRDRPTAIQARMKLNHVVTLNSQLLEWMVKVAHLSDPILV